MSYTHDGVGTGKFAGRVGAKAGGFMAKKWFHPSNMANQAKLFDAKELKRKQETRDAELTKLRRDEQELEMITADMKQVLLKSSGKSNQINIQSSKGGGLNVEDIAVKKKLLVEIGPELTGHTTPYPFGRKQTD